MTNLDIETIEHLDFEFEPPCEALQGMEPPYTPCEKSNPAEWIVVGACCGKTTLICDECLERKLNRKSLFCHICSKRFLPPRTAYASITRL